MRYFSCVVLVHSAVLGPLCMIMNVNSNFWIVFCDATFFVKHTNNTTSNRLSNCFETQSTIHKQNPHHAYRFEIYWMQLTLMCSFIQSFNAFLTSPNAKKKKWNIISRTKKYLSFIRTLSICEDLLYPWFVSWNTLNPILLSSLILFWILHITS